MTFFEMFYNENKESLKEFLFTHPFEETMNLNVTFPLSLEKRTFYRATFLRTLYSEFFDKKLSETNFTKVSELDALMLAFFNFLLEFETLSKYQDLVITFSFEKADYTTCIRLIVYNQANNLYDLIDSYDDQFKKSKEFKNDIENQICMLVEQFRRKIANQGFTLKDSFVKPDTDGNYNADNYLIEQTLSADNASGFYIQLTEL